MSSTHIRPRIRKSNAKTAKSQPKPSSTDDSNDSSVDNLERKMGSWMGLSSADDSSAANVTSQTETTTKSVAATMSPPASSPIPSEPEQTKTVAQETTTTAKNKPVGILKKPKYSSSGTSTITQTAKVEGVITTSRPKQKKSSSTPVVCEQFVVERDPFPTKKPMMRRKKKKNHHHHHQPNYNKPNNDTTTNNHASIEGYQPAASTQPVVSFSTSDQATTPSPKNQNTGSTRTDEAQQQQQQQAPPNNNKNSSAANTDTNEETEPLILSSLEELFDAAGKAMPADRSTITPDSQLVEADLSFSVMTQEQYGEKMTDLKREVAQEKEDMYRMFMGNDNVFGDGSSTHGGEGSDDDDSEGEEEFLNFLMEQDMDADGDDYYQDDDDDDENNAQESMPRAFALIWGALSRWWTPEAVEWMKRLEEPSSIDAPLYGNNWSPQVDRSDIGASRCAGLMAMVKMYLPSSLRELGHAPDLQRTAESRIGDWLRTFDYSAEAPKLPVSMWKAISCILLDMVLIESRSETDVSVKLPPSVAAVNMTIDEYKYLTRSAVQAFQP